MPVPAGIGKGVAVAVATLKAQVGEPIAVGRLLAILAHILKGPEVPPDVIEDPIQDQAHSAPVQLTAECRQGLVGSQAAVDRVVIGRIVAVARGLEQRSQVEGIRTQALDMVEPGENFV